MSNSPPYVSLELTEEEATALYRILTKEQADINANIKTVCEASSNSEIGRNRPMLMMKLYDDLGWVERFGVYMQEQQPELHTNNSSYRELVQRKAEELRSKRGE